MKAKLRRILYPDIPPRSAAIFNVLKMLIAMVIDGDYVMVRDVIYCSRFFQNWHSPELIYVDRYYFSAFIDKLLKLVRIIFE